MLLLLGSILSLLQLAKLHVWVQLWVPLTDTLGAPCDCAVHLPLWSPLLQPWLCLHYPLHSYQIVFLRRLSDHDTFILPVSSTLISLPHLPSRSPPLPASVQGQVGSLMENEVDVLHTCASHHSFSPKHLSSHPFLWYQRRKVKKKL